MKRLVKFSVQGKLLWLPVEIRFKAVCDIMHSNLALQPRQYRNSTRFPTVAPPSACLPMFWRNRCFYKPLPQLIRVRQVETIATDLTGALLPPITSWGSAHLIGSPLNYLVFSPYYFCIDIMTVTVLNYWWTIWRRGKILFGSILPSSCADTATRFWVCFFFSFFPDLLRLT